MILLAGLPTPVLIAIIVVAVALVGGVVMTIAKTMPIVRAIHADQFMKDSPTKWGRNCSDTTNEEQVRMWEAGCAWAKTYEANQTELSLNPNGYKLYGEYFDFGSKKCVLILPGRAECLMYSYYFAEPYRLAGYNVLVIDQRARGNSEGTYDSVGAKEQYDSIAWMNYITREYGIEEFCIHGICMGGQQAILIANNKECPKNLTSLVIDGVFIDFRETFKNHCIYIHKPWFPTTDEMMFLMWKLTGFRNWAMAPGRTVKKLKHRVLFMYGREDVFSRPDKSEIIFNRCASPDKQIEWFEHGPHSHLRINNVEQYDTRIGKFLNA